MRIRNSRVGLRLACAFGVLVLMLIAIACVGLCGANGQQHAQEEIVKEDAVSNDLLQLKFHLADANGSEVAYALAAVRGDLNAVDDTAGSRQEFLRDVQTFRDARDVFAAHTLDASKSVLRDEIDASFEQF